MGSDSAKVKILLSLHLLHMYVHWQFVQQREYVLEDYMSGQKGAVQIVDFKGLK